MVRGREIVSHRLEHGDVSVTILSLGCITQDWRVPHAGRRLPVVLGYGDKNDYRADPHHMGAIVGRVANRISGAGFDLAGRRYALDANEGAHTLHGGAGGLGLRHWTSEADGRRAVSLSYHSCDGEAGFPGAVDFNVVIRLQGHCLSYEMTARPARPTPISLAQHSYYNLGGSGDVRDHEIRIAARAVTPVDAEMIPTGEILPLRGQAFDFRTARRLAAADPAGRGFDLSYVLAGDKAGDKAGGKAGGKIADACLRAPNGMTLTLCADQPALQLYTGDHLYRAAAPHEGQRHAPQCAICLEPQQYPNAVNQPDFPSNIATPERPYVQHLAVTISPHEAP